MTVSIIEELTEIGPTLDLVGGKAECTRRVIIAGSDFATYATELFGAAFAAGWGFTYAQRPQHPRYTWMYGVSMGVPDTVPPKYAPLVAAGYPERIEVHIKYQGDLLNYSLHPDDPTPPSGTYMTHRKSMGVEMMTMPDACFRWADDDPPDAPRLLPGDIAPGIVMPTQTHTFTWRGVTYPPWEDINDAAGKVNESDQLGLKAETCLFIGAEEERVFDVNGTIQYTLSYTFAERKMKGKDASATPTEIDVTWNHFYRKAIEDTDTPANSRPAGWKKIQRTKKDGSGNVVVDPDNSIYDTYDFEKLFREGP